MVVDIVHAIVRSRHPTERAALDAIAEEPEWFAWRLRAREDRASALASTVSRRGGWRRREPELDREAAPAAA